MIKRENGITLIALVITIIVLLILAGVSIAMLTGENGILTQAKKAKEETNLVDEKERIKLAVTSAQIGDNGYIQLKKNSLQDAVDEQFGKNKAVVIDNEDGTFTIGIVDTNRDYNIKNNDVEEGINWNEIMANAKAPESQDEERNEGVIGIGTDGSNVDMDLWEFTYVSETDSYALNDFEVINNENIENKGYLGGINENGEIEGVVPMYIRSNTDEHFKPVTDMNNTFRECTELKISPEIPRTVTSMFATFCSCDNLEIPPVLPTRLENLYGTFYGCKNLKYAPDIPSSVITMADCFVRCEKIQKAPILPDNVVDLRGTFGHCKSLTVAPDIPSSVVNMKNTFSYCINLKKPPVIPEKVENMTTTFAGCYKLEGNLVINANPTSYENCFISCATDSNGLIVTGKSSVLDLIVNTKSENSNIIKGEI